MVLLHFYQRANCLLFQLHSPGVSAFAFVAQYAVCSTSQPANLPLHAIR